MHHRNHRLHAVVGGQWSYMSGMVARLALIGLLTFMTLESIPIHWRKCNHAHLGIQPSDWRIF